METFEPPRIVRGWHNLRANASLSGPDVACLALCTPFFAGWCFAVGGPLPPSGLAYLVALPWALALMGRLILRAVKAGPDLARETPLLIVLGATAFCVLLTLARLVLDLDLISLNLILFTLIALALALAAPEPAPPPEPERAGARRLLATFLSLAAATLWCQDLLPPVHRVQGAVVFQPFFDYFIHADVVAHFTADRGVLALGDYEASGNPLIFYHYFSYLLPASVSRFAGQSAYQVLASSWVPLGIFLTGLAAYSLASAWWGSGAGLCACAGLLLLPDASSYGFYHYYMSYHWFQQITPGLLYGVAAAALAVLFVDRGARRRRPVLTGLGMACGMLTVGFKAQIFVVLMPLLVLWFLVCDRMLPWKVRTAVVVLAAAAGAVLAIAVERRRVGPALLPDGSAASDYLAFMWEMMPEGYLKTQAFVLVGDPHAARGLIGGAAVLLAATLGILLILIVVISIIDIITRNFRLLNLFPAALLVVYIAGALLLPVNSYKGSPFELQHRPFVWAYFACSVWCWGKAATLLRGLRPLRTIVNPVTVVVPCLVLLAVPFWLGRGLQKGRYFWSPESCNIRVDQGLFDCAAFLRTRIHLEDIVQDSEGDEHLVLGGLSERREFVARRKVATRVADLAALKRAATVPELSEQAATTGIRWYVMHPQDRISWPSIVLDRPVFSSQGFRVYDLGSLAASARVARR
jgi:hypothetical protein